MQADINEHGVLTARAETALESYALQKWCDDNIANFPAGLIVDMGLHNTGNREVKFSKPTPPKAPYRA